MNASARTITKWFVVLSAGLILLAGRYDWSRAARAYSRSGYLASAYMFLLAVPTLYYTLQALGARPRFSVWLAAGFGGLCVIPYRWLGLARPPIWSDSVTWVKWNAPGTPEPFIDWFPQMRVPCIPNELVVFGGMALAGAATLAYLSRGIPKRQWLRSHPRWSICLGCYGLIVLQTWLHLSMRSPYTYVARFQQPPTLEKHEIVSDAAGRQSVRSRNQWVPHVWHHVYLLDDFRGAVNADYYVFRACEELFQGTPHEIKTTVIRRPFLFYLSSQFTYFINPFYVFLILNVGLWLAAAMCAYFFALTLAGPVVARFVALLTATGTGFIFFAAQPMSYLGGYAGAAILIYLFHLFVVRGNGPWGRCALCGAILGCGLLTSDLFPLLSFLIPYALVYRTPFRRIAASVGTCIAVYAGFLLLLPRILTAPIEQMNNRLLADSLSTIYFYLLHPEAEGFCIAVLRAANRYATDLIQAFFVLPLIPAVVGIYVLRGWRRAAVAALLFLPSLASTLVLSLGGARFAGWDLAALPRLNYVAYPGVYLLAALALERLDRSARSSWRRLLAPAFIGAVFLINNIDVVGIASPYYHFYFGLDAPGLPPFSLP